MTWQSVCRKVILHKLKMMYPDTYICINAGSKDAVHFDQLLLIIVGIFWPSLKDILSTSRVGGWSCIDDADVCTIHHSVLASLAVCVFPRTSCSPHLQWNRYSRIWLDRWQLSRIVINKPYACVHMNSITQGCGPYSGNQHYRVAREWTGW